MVFDIDFGGKDGEWLISAGSDGMVKVWDLKEGHIFYTIHGHKTASTAVCFARDEQGGKYFASGGADSTVMLWKATFNSSSKGNADRHVQEQSHKIEHHVEPACEQAPVFEIPKANDKAKTDSDKDATLYQEKKSVNNTKKLASTPGPRHREELAPEMVSQLVQQLGLLTQTMSIIEERLSKIEKTV